MPFGLDDAAVGALIAGAASAIGSGTNAIATGKLNRKNRRWQEKMFSRQNEVARENWEMQNAYNSPVRQMQRFREAGLNPNLIYGQGNAGNAGDISVGKPGNPDTSVPDVGSVIGGVKDGLFSYYDIRMKNAEISRVEKQNELIKLEEIYKSLRNSKLIVDTKLGSQLFGNREVANQYTGKLLETQLEMWDLQMQKTRQDMQLDLNKDEREAIASSRDLFTAIEKIGLLRATTAKTWAERQRIYAQINNIKTDTAIKELDRQLKASGVMPTDNIVARIISRYFGAEIGQGIMNAKDYIKNEPFSFKDWFDQRRIGEGSIRPNPYKK